MQQIMNLADRVGRIMPLAQSTALQAKYVESELAAVQQELKLLAAEQGTSVTRAARGAQVLRPNGGIAGDDGAE